MKKTITVVGAVAFALPVLAGIELGTPFADHAVLQRGMKVPVWGKVTPEMNTLPPRITVSFAGQEKSVTVDGATGCWKVELDPMEASKAPRTLTVTKAADSWWLRLFGDEETVEVKDVLVGEVWFASGQSNMECPIWGGNTRYRDGNGALVIEMTKLPNVRCCKNAQRWSVDTLPLKAQWRTMTPENMRTVTWFSAVAYYYARELYLALDVPIGIIDSSWGGTNIDAWTPRCGYEGCDPSIEATAKYAVKKDWNAKTDRKGPIGGAHQQPTVLFNGMVASWAPMAMRGFIWYQGCHNSGEPGLYCAKMHALHNGWSRAFANPDLKLYFVQLAPYSQNWMGIVGAQNKFAGEEPRAALAVTADVGNFDDIHPNRKEVVAKRLAVHALKRDYGFDIREDDSPVLKAAKFNGAKAELTFDHVANWYVYAPNYSLDAAFELAGTNGVWQAAKIANLRTHLDKKTNKTVTDPYVDGPKLVLTSDKVAKPVKARYMGKNRTMGTVYNEMSLPLGPFEVVDR